MSTKPAQLIAERYRLVALVGEGGMGRVWAARDELLGRDVAVKELVLPKGLTETEEQDLRVRVIREARAIARIDHPNVVRIFDVLHERGEPWIVMELVPSRSLYEVVSKDGPLPPARVAEIGLGVLAALRAAHQVGLLHRDVKPGNVLLGTNGRVVLTDFGLATAAGDSSMTSTGVVLGSPSYLAPERALDDPIGPPADLWSLGATLYTAVEGRPPYSKSSPMATLAALATEQPRPPQQAGPLKPALNGLLQKDPARRADATTAERLLRTAATAVSPPAPRTPKNRKLLLVGALALATVAVLAGIVALSSGPDEKAEAGGKPAFVSSPGLPPPPTAAAHEQAAGPAQTQASAPAPAKPRPSRTRAVPTEPTAADTKPTPAAEPSKPLRNRQTGTCLDVPAGSSQLRMFHCNGTDAQNFTLSADGTMRVNRQCVQIGNTGAGSQLFTAACDGSAFQRFTLTKTEDLVSAAADKCVDVPSGDGGDGVLAQLWSCNGSSNQKWRH
ncbi:protein kinase [Actinoplanes sp. NPDC049265]|uniref:protein kinase domain-containing protein n=1 Tax=Actinoplanes sp. NPDC049265 TaxID=3363902 RepID=UPI003713764A